MKRRILAAAFLTAGLFFAVKDIDASEHAHGLEGLFIARYENPQPMAEDLLDNLDLSDGQQILLSRESTRDITGPLFWRSKRLTLIETAGNASLLFLPGRLVKGVTPTQRGECLIDETSALELWGTAAPLGYTVVWGPTEYTVTGVVKAARPLLLVNGETENNFAFTSVFYKAEDAAFARRGFDVILQKLSADSPLVEEPGLLSARLRFAALLPFWLLLAILAAKLGRFLPFGPAPRFITVAAVDVLAFWLLQMPNPITPEMLPTTWSDFSFWPRRFTAQLDYFCRVWFMRGNMGGLLVTLELTLPVLTYTAAALGAIIVARAFADAKKPPG